MVIPKDGPDDPWCQPGKATHDAVMAGIGMGSISRASNVRRGPDADCAHPETLTTTTAGLERVICETCGHLSVRYLATLPGPIDRGQFERPADTVVDPMPDGWDADQEPFLVRDPNRWFAPDDRTTMNRSGTLYPELAVLAG